MFYGRVGVGGGWRRERREASVERGTRIWVDESSSFSFSFSLAGGETERVGMGVEREESAGIDESVDWRVERMLERMASSEEMVEWRWRRCWMRCGERGFSMGWRGPEM